MSTAQKVIVPKEEKFIDIEKVIASKNPHLLKVLPGFILNYIKNILHNDEINKAVFKHKDNYGLEFVGAVLDDFGLIRKLHGSHNLPSSNKIIIASNHPLGGPDGLALMDVVGKYKKKMKFIVNDILLNIENLKDLFIPVNKHGSNPKDAVKLMDEIYSSENVVLTFPFGLVSRKRSGTIQDLVWHKNFVSKAKKYQRNIVPVYISGRNSNFFYNLANLRKALKIKANIEMFFLPNEMFKQAGKDINIYIGKEISWQTFDHEYTDAQWAEKLRKFVYHIPDNINAEFNPNYND